MSNALTERQKDILMFINGYKEVHKICPTLEEVGNAVNLISVSAAKTAVDQMQEMDLVKHEKGKSRTLRLTPKGKQVLAEYVESISRVK